MTSSWYAVVIRTKTSVASLFQEFKRFVKGYETGDIPPRIDKYKYLAQRQMDLITILAIHKSELTTQAYDYLKCFQSCEWTNVLLDSPEKGIESDYASYFNRAKKRFEHELEVVKTLSDVAIELRWTRIS